MWRCVRYVPLARALEKSIKICLLGANGNIGRPLALYLKLNKYLSELALFDTRNLSGLREDLSHIDTKPIVTGYSGDEKNLVECLRCSDVVVIIAGQAHSPKFSSREAMFSANGGLMIKFMKSIVESCGDNMPFIHIVSNPVNTLVPVCAEYLKTVGCYNPRKIAGSCSVDAMRARTFLGQLKDYDPARIKVPVVGGHSVGSITPLLSHSQPNFKLNIEEYKKLSHRIINGAAEVSDAKQHHGAACLSMGFCIAKFCDSVFRALHGHKNVFEIGFVPADINELEFFGCSFTLGPKGIQKCHRIPDMTPLEMQLYKRAFEDVKKNIETAKKFVRNYKEK